MGCEPLGGVDWGEVDDDQVRCTLKTALDLGINTFDTADVYGLGRSERVLSDVLGAYRHEVVIITKFGVNWESPVGPGRAETFLDSSPKHVVEALEASLRRLRVDTIPLYLIHWPDPDTPLADTIEALLKCQDTGKIRYLGVSNFPAPLIGEAHGHARLSVAGCQYSLIDRSPEEAVFPCCSRLGISVVVYGTLAQGLLTGKYGADTQFSTHDRRHRLLHFQTSQWKTNTRLLDKLRKTGRRYGKSAAQVAINWTLNHPNVACAVVGAKSPEQMKANVASVGWKLQDQDRKGLLAQT